MKSLATLALLLASLSACTADSPYNSPDTIWTLKELGNSPFPATATLTFPKVGEVAGAGPFNRYFGAMTATYPAFSAGPIGSTRIACPELAAEIAFLDALQSATASEVTENTLLLTNADGLRMLFKTTD
jgi:heat shock protein HslJ